MNNIRRAAAVFAAVMTIVLLSSCTPEQLAMYEQLTGHDVDETTLIPLDDGPMNLADGRQILADGSVVDCVAKVNGLAYSYDLKAPVIEAFRTVTACRGWTAAETASWETAVWDIALKEAHACWNVRYGARFAAWDGAGCVLSKKGSGASGYGQITSVLHPITCRLANLCSGPAIVASPYTSMLSLVVLIEDQGVSPWCYDRFSRNFHRVACGNPGHDVG